MVAEPIAETEQPVTEVTPETLPEPEAPPESDELSEDSVAAFLKEQKLITGTDESDGKDSASDANEPDLEGLTPQQILDLGKQKGKSEVQTEAQARAAEQQQQARIAGARNVVFQAKAKAMQRLAQLGYDATEVGQEYDQVYGAFNLVVEDAVRSAEAAALQSFQDTTAKLAAQALGPKGKDVVATWQALPDDQKSSEKFFSLFTEKAREGYYTASDMDKEFTKRFSVWMKNLDPERRAALGVKSPMETGSGTGVASKLNFKNLGEAEAAHVAGKITNAQMRDLIAKGLKR